jgi:hypothetical protein
MTDTSISRVFNQFAGKVVSYLDYANNTSWETQQALTPDEHRIRFDYAVMRHETGTVETQMTAIELLLGDGGLQQQLKDAVGDGSYGIYSEDGDLYFSVKHLQFLEELEAARGLSSLPPGLADATRAKMDAAHARALAGCQEYSGDV